MSTNVRARLWCVAALVVAGCTVWLASEGLLGAAHEPSAHLHRVWSLFAVGALVGGAIRLCFALTRVAVTTVFALGFAAVMFAGEAHHDARYLALAGVYVALGLGAMGVMDRAVRPDAAVDARRRVDHLVLLALTVVITAAGLSVLPPLHRRAEQLMLHALSAYETRSGLSDRLELDALDGLLQSDEVVLRVYGPAPDRLRGIVYDTYVRPKWRGDSSSREVDLAPGPLTGDGVTELRRVGGDPRRFFLPLEFGAISLAPAHVRVDAFGAVATGEEDEPSRVWLRAGHARASATVRAPTVRDTAVPDALRSRLEPLVRTWTNGAGEDAAVRMAALSEALRRNDRYALSFERDPRLDPVVDFLFEHRAGHCEYFASALALLGRTAGVPTRVVVGYRVAERNGVGNYYVVRQKNAHAWVEAWVGDGWHTYDATPLLELPQNLAHETPWWSAVRDAIGNALGAARTWAADLTARDLLAAALVLTAVFFAQRAVRTRLAARSARARQGDTHEALDGFVALSTALASAGLARADGEAVETFAHRVSTSDRVASGTAARVRDGLMAYAALRYGGIGNASEVGRVLGEAAGEVAAGSGGAGAR